MALHIDFDSFGFLSNEDLSALSQKQQSSISPIGSDSSSGISSLDSDDLKKHLLSSPTISQDDDDQQSDGNCAAEEKETLLDENDKHDEIDDDLDEIEPTKEIEEEVEAIIAVEKIIVVPEVPVKVMYQNRDILDLSSNAFGSGQLVQYTVLPENNVNCFFQNRAQYYRLSSSERTEYPVEKCPCFSCDFTYPSTHPQLNQTGPTVNGKDSLTDSILTFLKSTEQMNVGMPKRMMNNNTPFAYQMQKQQPPQQYIQTQSNGFYGSNANYNQPSMNFMNNGSGYGTTLALLNLMNNATVRNTASAFQAITNGGNNHRFYNNNNMNNNFGAYKHF